MISIKKLTATVYRGIKEIAVAVYRGITVGAVFFIINLCVLAFWKLFLVLVSLAVGMAVMALLITASLSFMGWSKEHIRSLFER